jgi:hypothetical protein
MFHTQIPRKQQVLGEIREEEQRRKSTKDSNI